MPRRRNKCRHCGTAIYQNSRDAGNSWRHVETGWQACQLGMNPHPDNKAEPE